jgi:hypothetical protein
VRALLCPLFPRSAWNQPATVVAGTTSEGAALASVPPGRRGLSQAQWWRERQVSALFCPLLAWSACAQTTTVLAGTTVEGAALASVSLFGVGTDNLCVGGNDTLGR